MKTVVIIPTYNEKENIVRLLQSIRSFSISGLEILVVDDSSPDKTGELVLIEKQKEGNPIHLMTRSKKEGLGKAYASGFAWALKQGFDYAISMDADFSHNPKDISRLLSESLDYDVVIGSRYIRGGGIVGWSLYRQINSRGANIVTRSALGLKPRDVTAGFKRYSRDFLISLFQEQIIASGYAFQVETLFHAKNNSFRVTEIPIIFIDRTRGESKISGELTRSAKIVGKLFMKRPFIKKFRKM